MYQRTATAAGDEPSTHGMDWGRQDRTARPHGNRRRRRSSRRTTAFTSNLQGPPSSGVFQKLDEKAVRVRFALHRLPDLTDRAILVLRFFVGLSLEDIADKLLLPLESARERYLLGLRFMERELGGDL